MKNAKKNHYLGGLGILTAVSLLCLEGLREIDRRIREKNEKTK